jgi:phosphohistidine phosphatase SixA
VPVYLIRHAHAGSRSGWNGDDDRRPLSPKGRTQADGITAWLRDETIDEVRSSPSMRCRETVDAMAEAHGLRVAVDRSLGEGADVDGCIAAVLDSSDRTLVLCTHGDLIPKVIHRLVAKGMRTSAPNLSQKGSAWVLEVVEGEAVSARYQPPFGKVNGSSA